MGERCGCFVPDGTFKFKWKAAGYRFMSGWGERILYGKNRSKAEMALCATRTRHSPAFPGAAQQGRCAPDLPGKSWTLLGCTLCGAAF